MPAELSKWKLSIGEVAYKKVIYYLLSGNSPVDLADLFLEELYAQKHTHGSKLNDFVNLVLAEETSNRQHHEDPTNQQESAFEPFDEAYDRAWEEGKPMSSAVWE